MTFSLELKLLTFVVNVKELRDMQQFNIFFSRLKSDFWLISLSKLLLLVELMKLGYSFIWIRD